MPYKWDDKQLLTRADAPIDRLLKGAWLADLPIEQASTSRLAIDVNTAKALGLTVLPSVQLRADEVVQ